MELTGGASRRRANSGGAQTGGASRRDLAGGERAGEERAGAALAGGANRRLAGRGLVQSGARDRASAGTSGSRARGLGDERSASRRERPRLESAHHPGGGGGAERDRGDRDRGGGLLTSGAAGC